MVEIDVKEFVVYWTCIHFDLLGRSATLFVGDLILFLCTL